MSIPTAIKESGYDTCAICLENLSEKPAVIGFQSCDHLFHGLCVVELIQAAAKEREFTKCPLCRIKVTGIRRSLEKRPKKDTCVICLSEASPAQVKSASCIHLFHAKCMAELIQAAALKKEFTRCPSCQTRVRGIESAPLRVFESARVIEKKAAEKGVGIAVGSASPKLVINSKISVVLAIINANLLSTLGK